MQIRSDSIAIPLFCGGCIYRLTSQSLQRNYKCCAQIHITKIKMVVKTSCYFVIREIVNCQISLLHRRFLSLSRNLTPPQKRLRDEPKRASTWEAIVRSVVTAILKLVKLQKRLDVLTNKNYEARHCERGDCGITCRRALQICDFSLIGCELCGA